MTQVLAKSRAICMSERGRLNMLTASIVVPSIVPWLALFGQEHSPAEAHSLGDLVLGDAGRLQPVFYVFVRNVVCDRGYQLVVDDVPDLFERKVEPHFDIGGHGKFGI